ncbi:hypothetical protein EVAR_97070_1 [Eumeta japonica]|uniref:Uncharacterized protein n=1 Tax=Eumeta variegata TaxID=151549 RepID=A0A4C1X8V8_EUMVA|nr:hypothetical protein EVAR_97070_1 [Eumeta japonica]
MTWSPPLIKASNCRRVSNSLSTPFIGMRYLTEGRRSVGQGSGMMEKKLGNEEGVTHENSHSPDEAHGKSCNLTSALDEDAIRNDTTPGALPAVAYATSKKTESKKDGLCDVSRASETGDEKKI